MKHDGYTTGMPTEDQLIDWLSVGGRTLGWDAWMAYDAGTTNSSLWHDYIARFTMHPSAQPVSGQAMVVDNQFWEYLDNVRFGAPRMEFASSTIGSEWLSASLRAMAGTQLTVDVPDGGSRRVIKVERYSPLHGPKLSASFRPGGNTATEGAARDLQIDVSTGKDYKFTYTDTRQGQLRGGSFLQRQLAALPADHRFCELNRVNAAAPGPLTPAEVRVRAFPLVNDGGGLDSDGGALVLFMAAEGSEVGSLPDGDSAWPYPIPAGSRATLVISNRSLMTAVIPHDIRVLAPDADFEYGPPGPYEGPNVIVATQGTLDLTRVEAQVDPFLGVSYEFRSSLADPNSVSTKFSVARELNGFAFAWSASSFHHEENWKLETRSTDGVTDVDYAWKIERAYRYGCTDDGSLTAVAVGAGRTWVQPMYRQAGALDPQHYQCFAALSDGVAAAIAEKVSDQFIEMSGVGAVNNLRMAGLEFPGCRAMKFGSAHLPADLAIFGAIEMRAGSFEISPLDPLMEAGGELQFTAPSAQEGIEWHLERVSGFPEAVGRISGDGRYKAPSSEELAAEFTLVKVTARSGDHVSSALLTVMAERLAINPVVFSAWSTGGRTRVAGGCVDRGVLDWEVSSSSGATLEEAPVDGDAIFDPGDRLYVPGSPAGDVFFSVDVITATNPRTGDSRTSSVLVVGKQLRGVITISEAPGLSADQLLLTLEAGAGPIQGVHWAVPIGGGSIDQEGVYTMDRACRCGFAVVTAELTVPGFGDFGNYLILPVPLVELDVLRSILAS